MTNEELVTRLKDISGSLKNTRQTLNGIKPSDKSSNACVGISKIDLDSIDATITKLIKELNV